MMNIIKTNDNTDLIIALFFLKLEAKALTSQNEPHLNREDGIVLMVLEDNWVRPQHLTILFSRAQDSFR